VTTSVTEIDHKAEAEGKQTEEDLKVAESDKACSSWLEKQVRDHPGESTKWHIDHKSRLFTGQQVKAILPTVAKENKDSRGSHWYPLSGFTESKG